MYKLKLQIEKPSKGNEHAGPTHLWTMRNIQTFILLNLKTTTSSTLMHAIRLENEIRGQPFQCKIPHCTKHFTIIFGYIILPYSNTTQ